MPKYWIDLSAYNMELLVIGRQPDRRLALIPADRQQPMRWPESSPQDLSANPLTFLPAGDAFVSEEPLTAALLRRDLWMARFPDAVFREGAALLRDVTAPDMAAALALPGHNFSGTAPLPRRVPAALHSFLSESQMHATENGLRGEESAFFAERMDTLANVVAAMPSTYETDGKGDAAVVYLHYFLRNADWYITEKDGDPDNTGQVQAFGLADLGQGYPELGYINLQEVIRLGAEMDYHFEPRSLLDLKREKYPELVQGIPNTPKKVLQASPESLDVLMRDEIIQNHKDVVGRAQRIEDFETFMASNIVLSVSRALTSIMNNPESSVEMKAAAKEVLQGPQGMTDYRWHIGRVVFDAVKANAVARTVKMDHAVPLDRWPDMTVAQLGFSWRDAKSGKELVFETSQGPSPVLFVDGSDRMRIYDAQDALKSEVMQRVILPLLSMHSADWETTLRDGGVNTRSLSLPENVEVTDRVEKWLRLIDREGESVHSADLQDASLRQVFGTPLQQAMLRKIALSEYTSINGAMPKSAAETETWADTIIETAEDKGVFASLKNANMVWHSGQKSDAGVGLTEEGFLAFMAMERQLANADAAERAAAANSGDPYPDEPEAILGLEEIAALGDTYRRAVQDIQEDGGWDAVQNSVALQDRQQDALDHIIQARAQSVGGALMAHGWERSGASFQHPDAPGARIAGSGATSRSGGNLVKWGYRISVDRGKGHRTGTNIPDDFREEAETFARRLVQNAVGMATRVDNDLRGDHPVSAGDIRDVLEKAITAGWSLGDLTGHLRAMDINAIMTSDDINRYFYMPVPASATLAGDGKEYADDLQPVIGMPGISVMVDEQDLEAYLQAQAQADAADHENYEIEDSEGSSESNQIDEEEPGVMASGLDQALLAHLRERQSIRQGEHPKWNGLSDNVVNAREFARDFAMRNPELAEKWAADLRGNPFEYGEAMGLESDNIRGIATLMEESVKRVRHPQVGDLVRFEPHDPSPLKGSIYSGRVIAALGTSGNDVRYHLRAESGPDAGMEATVYGKNGDFSMVDVEDAYGFERNAPHALSTERQNPSRGDYLRFLTDQQIELEGVVLDSTKLSGVETLRMRRIYRWPDGTPGMDGADHIMSIVLPDDLLEHVPGAAWGVDLDAIDPLTDVYKRTMGTGDERAKAEYAVLTMVEIARGVDTRPLPPSGERIKDDMPEIVDQETGETRADEVRADEIRTDRRVDAGRFIPFSKKDLAKGRASMASHNLQEVYQYIQREHRWNSEICDNVSDFAKSLRRDDILGKRDARLEWLKQSGHDVAQTVLINALYRLIPASASSLPYMRMNGRTRSSPDEVSMKAMGYMAVTEAVGEQLDRLPVEMSDAHWKSWLLNPYINYGLKSGTMIEGGDGPMEAVRLTSGAQLIVEYPSRYGQSGDRIAQDGVEGIREMLSTWKGLTPGALVNGSGLQGKGKTDPTDLLQAVMMELTESPSTDVPCVWQRVTGYHPLHIAKSVEPLAAELKDKFGDQYPEETDRYWDNMAGILVAPMRYLHARSRMFRDLASKPEILDYFLETRLMPVLCNAGFTPEVGSTTNASLVDPEKDEPLMEEWGVRKKAPEVPYGEISRTLAPGVIDPSPRNGRDITDEEFVQDTGFSVQYGNYVNNRERQALLNMAYDGLHDIAAVLDVPVSSLAVRKNGVPLALALGARGSGNAAAHYEPGMDTHVINLTKTKGAGGALVHEWLHAVDASMYASNMEISGFRDLRLKGGHASQKGDNVLHGFVQHCKKPLHFSEPERSNDALKSKVSRRIELWRDRLSGKWLTSTLQKSFLSHLEANLKHLPKTPEEQEAISTRPATEYLPLIRQRLEDIAQNTAVGIATGSSPAALRAFNESVQFWTSNGSRIWSYDEGCQVNNQKAFLELDPTLNDLQSRAVGIAFTEAFFDVAKTEFKAVQRYASDAHTLSQRSDFYGEAFMRDAGRKKPYLSTPEEMLAYAGAAAFYDLSRKRGIHNDFLDAYSSPDFKGIHNPEGNEREAFTEHFEQHTLPALRTFLMENAQRAEPEQREPRQMVANSDISL